MKRGCVLACALASCVPAPTFEEVAPILESRCASCHRNGIGPDFMADYESVAALQFKVRDVVTFREMPPFGLDNTTACGGSYFANEGLSLGEDEIKTIATWVDEGAQAGDLARLRPGMPYVGAELRSVDATLRPEPYVFDGAVPGSLHRCFVLDPAIVESRFLTAFEVVPGDMSKVSGVALYALDDAGARGAALALDMSDVGPGYHCASSPGVSGARFIGTWVWGRPVVRLPEGTGLRLDAGTLIVAQIRYSAQGSGFGPTVDPMRIDLELARDARAASFTQVAVPAFSLRPGVRSAEVRGFVEVKEGTEVLGIVPVMHTLGHDMQLDRVRPFSTTCMARVTYWDHDNHRRLYQYMTTPPTLLPGDQLAIKCGFDTRSRIEPISRGDGEADEECAAYLYAIPNEQ